MMAKGQPDFNQVFDSQRTFGALLKATARPGKIVRLPETRLNSPRNLNPYPMLILLSLLDHEVGFEVLDEESITQDLDGLRDYIALKTRSNIVPCHAADFILVYGGSSKGRIIEAQRGSLAYPDLGATLLYDLEAIGGDPEDGLTLQLTGPGIVDVEHLQVRGLKDDEVRSIMETRQEFPMGIDVILADNQGNVAALPRSTEISCEVVPWDM